MLPKLIFFLALIFVVTPYSSPPIALAIGLAFGLFLHHPYSQQTKYFSKTLLQVCVVGLGFGMNLQQVIRAGRSGFIYTALGITGTMLLGLALGRLLKVAET